MNTKKKKKSEQFTVSVSDGKIRYIYKDSLLLLHSLGQATITRASNVEPNKDGEWVAQIIRGPKLGPFKRREDALAAEVKYLEEHQL